MDKLLRGESERIEYYDPVRPDPADPYYTYTDYRLCKPAKAGWAETVFTVMLVLLFVILTGGL